MTATCFESQAALNAALTATSVFPNPTSPHTSLSIGLFRSMSAFTSAVALSWSGVSSYRKLASSSCCRKESFEKANPFDCCRAA